MIPSNFRKELARQTMGFMSWLLSHTTTVGIICSWIVTVWGMISLFTGTINLCIRIRQLCNNRDSGATISCCHVLLTLWEALDSSYNPLNHVSSALKRSVLDLIAQTNSQDLKIAELSGEIYALKIRIRSLETPF